MSKYISELSLLCSNCTPDNVKIKALNSILKGIGVYGLNESFVNKFISDPASTKYHGSHKGGLIKHSANVALILINWEAAGIVKFKLERSPVVIGLLHDICKVGTYKMNEDGGYEYNKESKIWKGHATKSLSLLATDLFRGLDLTEQEALCIRYHMGAYETDEWDEYGKAIAKYPEVLFTHTADMYSTHVNDI